MKSIIDFLQGEYGSLMTIEQLAQTLSRKPAGLRGVLQKPTEPWMFELNQVRRRIGRRIYFPTDAVAALLNGDFDHEDYDHSICLERSIKSIDLNGMSTSTDGPKK